MATTTTSPPIRRPSDSQLVTVHLPDLYPAQYRAMYDPARISVIEASTKSGKTVGAMRWITHLSMADKQPRDWWWIAPFHRTAEIPYRRMKRGIDPRFYTAFDSAPFRMTWKHNGATIWFRSAENPDALYGEDVAGAVVDEFTRCREETWPALRSTLTFTRGPVRLIGNVRGRKNWGYRLARRAEGGEAGMGYHKITAWDAVQAGVLDADEIRSAERDLPAHIFKELYLAEASDDGGNPFGIPAIQAAVAPFVEGEPVAWGWDLAKSVDWTVGIGLDAGGAVVRFVRFQSDWEQTKNRIVAETGDVPALIDSTGVGDPIMEDLARRLPHVEGFKFSGPSKQQIMEGLAAAIASRSLTLIEGVLQSELESFEYEYTRTGVRYTAPVGMHDDTVDALALAVRKWSTKRKTWTVD